MADYEEESLLREAIRAGLDSFSPRNWNAISEVLPYTQVFPDVATLAHSADF